MTDIVIRQIVGLALAASGRAAEVRCLQGIFSQDRMQKLNMEGGGTLSVNLLTFLRYSGARRVRGRGFLPSMATSHLVASRPPKLSYSYDSLLRLNRISLFYRLLKKTPNHLQDLLSTEILGHSLLQGPSAPHSQPCVEQAPQGPIEACSASSGKRVGDLLHCTLDRCDGGPIMVPES